MNMTDREIFCDKEFERRARIHDQEESLKKEQKLEEEQELEKQQLNNSNQQPNLTLKILYDGTNSSSFEFCERENRSLCIHRLSLTDNKKWASKMSRNHRPRSDLSWPSCVPKILAL